MQSIKFYFHFKSASFETATCLIWIGQKYLLMKFWCLTDCTAPSVHCNDGSCVANANVCDTTKDCPDGEDERDCGEWLPSLWIASVIVFFQFSSHETASMVSKFHLFPSYYRVPSSKHSLQWRYLRWQCKCLWYHQRLSWWRRWAQLR